MMDLLNCRLLSFAVELDSLIITDIFRSVNGFATKSALIVDMEISEGSDDDECQMVFHLPQPVRAAQPASQIFLPKALTQAAKKTIKRRQTKISDKVLKFLKIN